MTNLSSKDIFWGGGGDEKSLFEKADLSPSFPKPSKKLLKPSLTKLKAPFAWVGGKSFLARQIIALMPAHERYVEVFGGALSVLYQKSKSKQEIINDINDELINLHKVIQTKPLSLMNALQNLLISRKLFEWIKNKQLSPRNDIEKAAFYYYLIAFSFASKGLHFSHTKVRASAIYKDFKPFSKRLKGVFIENKSFEYILKNYDDENTLFYLDPPYVNTEKYYQNTSVFGEHELLAELLKGVRGKFMLSYNDNELIRELYKGFFIKELELRYTLNNKNKGKMSKELLIMNFKP